MKYKLKMSTGQEVEIEAESVSDGYHTFEELYDHRLALNVVLFNYIAWHRGGVVKSMLHHDGTMFEGYFVVMMAGIDFDEHLYPDMKGAKQITYHYKLEHWDKFKIDMIDKLPPYDGHTSKDVIERLLEYGQIL